MKKQTLGIVLGANLAVCLALTGCKAGQSSAVSKMPANDAAPVVTVTEPASTVKPVEVAPVEQPVIVVTETKPVAKPEVKPAVETTTYVVTHGDTISKISKRYNIRQGAILAANPGLNADKIRLGQKIVLPGKVKIEAAPVAAKTVKPADVKAPKVTKSEYKPYTGATKEYVVQSGDILGTIAQKNGISIRALKELNGLAIGPKGNALKIGQKLKVPAEKQAKAPAKKSVVDDKASEKKAPVLDKPVEQPVADKPVEPEVKIETPVAAADAAAEKTDTAASVPVEVAEPAAATRTHVVKEGEDIVSIAINYGISPSVLLDLNGFNAGDELKVGQSIKVPAANAKSE